MEHDIRSASLSAISYQQLITVFIFADWYCVRDKPINLYILEALYCLSVVFCRTLYTSQILHSITIHPNADTTEITKILNSLCTDFNNRRLC